MNGAAAFDILLLLATPILLALGAGTAVLSLALDRRWTRAVHYVVLACIVGLYVRWAVVDPNTLGGLLTGGSVPNTTDFPVLKMLPFAPLLLLVACSPPLIRMVRRTGR